MKAHPRCLALGCQMQLRLELLGVQPPKFCLGQCVSTTFEDEFGQSQTLTGIIVGVLLAPHQWLGGWWYTVRFAADSIGGDRLYDCEDECHESQLTAGDRTEP